MSLRNELRQELIKLEARREREEKEAKARRAAELRRATEAKIPDIITRLEARGFSPEVIGVEGDATTPAAFYALVEDVLFYINSNTVYVHTATRWVQVTDRSSVVLVVNQLTTQTELPASCSEIWRRRDQ